MHHSPVATLHKTGRTIFTALKFLPAWLKFLIATTPMIAITARVPHTRTKIQILSGDIDKPTVAGNVFEPFPTMVARGFDHFIPRVTESHRDRRFIIRQSRANRQVKVADN
jgi:hypothetical protein